MNRIGTLTACWVLALLFTVYYLLSSWTLTICLAPTSNKVDTNNFLKQTKGSVKLAMTINVLGRLGNLMGEYATLYALAETNSYPAVLSPEMNMLRKYFHLTIPAIEQPVLDKIPWTIQSLQDWMEDKYRHFQEPFVKLQGYPNSWTFYHHIREQIRQEFTFRPEISASVHTFLSRIKGNRSSVSYVGIHVRRGDYIALMRQTYQGVLADSKYLSSAMDYYRQRNNNVLFVVCSDDIQWCYKNIEWSRGDAVLCWDGAPSDPGLDMALLSNCNHSIITMGTFGFWSAYLAGGDVVYMANFTAPNSTYNSLVHANATFLPQWVGISANLSSTDWL